MKKALIAIAIATSLSGCATIIGSTTQPLTIKSTPEGANVVVINRAGEKIHSGVAPMTVTLNRGAGYFKPEIYTIKFDKEGYESKEVVVTGQVNGWYFGNIIFGGLIIGMLIVDPNTGAMYSLSSDKVEEALVAVGAKTSKVDNALTIVSVADVPAELMKSARRIN
ncbi:MAG: hypothetical protein JNL16_09570 [Dechloromonas sp.]|uniref:hypothetical protein n=1 Tax=Dechloromonas sp. CZR5 TaxID=2608630 RepID=UPI00123E20C9|nr:hypothetical protein [Dechloromonas sp. CZR5]MBL8404776.1 hypothetical protein [Dechloromonas sp.]